MPLIFFRSLNNAGVAELADALDSKSSVLWDVWVQVPPPAPLKTMNNVQLTMNNY